MPTITILINKDKTSNYYNKGNLLKDTFISNNELNYEPQSRQNNKRSARNNNQNQNFNSKVEMFDPKEFNDKISSYSDNSITRSIKKPKRSIKFEGKIDRCERKSKLYIAKNINIFINNLKNNKNKV